MSINREVVKYMALPYNGIIAAIKKKKNDDIYALIREDILLTEKCRKTFLSKGPGEGWDKATPAIRLCMQRGSGKDTQSVNTVLTKSG